jgi:2-keto-4-pentenoate hydratase/2-oxohepta-3-ene-1,7-dioic acid hydratase in catechol pathway
MQIVRFRAAGKILYGALEGSQIVEYAGTPYGAFKRARKKYPLRHAVLLAPVVPSKIVAVGCNYRERAQEIEAPIPAEPIIFLKALSALCGPDDPIVCPPDAASVEYEGELAVVIKKRCRQVSVERAREHVLGYTCLNDVTARHLVGPDRPWARAKSFDSFCPVGPCIATDLDPHAAEVETYVNGAKRQASNTKALIFPVEDLLARISAVMTLLPGDIIATGTPGGVGPMVPGDRVEVRIEGIGALKNPVIRM